MRAWTLLIAVCPLALACSNQDAPATRPDLPPASIAALKAVDPVTDHPGGLGPTQSVEDFQPWFDTPPLRAALTDFLEGRNRKAAEALERWTSTHEEDPRQRPVRFLALLAWHDGGVYDPTAARLEAMAIEWPLLRDYALYYAGSCHLRSGRYHQANSVLEKVAPRAVPRRRAVELQARAARAQGREAEAISLLEDFLHRAPESREDLWMLLATLYEDTDRPERARAARQEVATRFPSRPAGREALRRLGKTHGLSPVQFLTRGKVFYKAQRHTEAIEALTVALKGLEKGTEHHCEALTHIARTHDKLKARDTAWSWYTKALACEGQPLAIATFAGGRNRFRVGDDRRALELMRRHVDTFPNRSTVDDTLTMMAHIHRRQGRDAQADKLLWDQLARMPDGDYAYDGAWKLLWPRVEAGRWEEALAIADRLLTIMPRDDHYRSEGRTLYWKARALMATGRREDAHTTWRDVLVRYPLSWYALLAYARLAQSDPSGAPQILTEVVGASTPPSSPLAVIPPALRDDAHFQKAVALARMGLGESARRELARVPTPPPKDREAWDWTMVFLYDLAGDHSRATRLARTQEGRLAQAWPVGSDLALWTLAHPRPFGDAVARWSEAHGLEPAWLWSIMREESGFDPNITSWAGAHGLMQIILPTARVLARGTNITPNEKALLDPEVAIRLGAKYLARLQARHVSFPLASAGYNAGGRAVDRWRRAFGDQPLDIFVEKIPFREARGYAKRVTRSIARYRWLYGGQSLLAIDLSPPGTPPRGASTP